ncbi:hypothetical protein BGZ60DRAFT_432404 [Tricladium varicosporioides]|nr:hypothetical protein BGZ60DRAFT_432404 [Hymenoscyphus varicosporioides]
MCLFTARPKWEEEVVFANRPHRHHSHSHHSSRVRVSETYITKQTQRPSVEFVPAPLPSPSPKPLPPPSPKVITATPPRAPSPPSSRIELISVEEDRHHHSPRSSRVSVSHEKRSRRASSNRGEEVYIERERIRERVAAPEPPSREEYETYQYVPAPPAVDSRRRSRSITYETNPRVSGRVTERERVVIEDGGRRREYYRRP